MYSVRARCAQVAVASAIGLTLGVSTSAVMLYRQVQHDRQNITCQRGQVVDDYRHFLFGGIPYCRTVNEFF